MFNFQRFNFMNSSYCISSCIEHVKSFMTSGLVVTIVQYMYVLFYLIIFTAMLSKFVYFFANFSMLEEE